LMLETSADAVRDKAGSATSPSANSRLFTSVLPLIAFCFAAGVMQAACY
jgi:hypothetical protein